MKYFTKRSVGVVLVVLLLLPVVSQAQFGGVVYDPTNYANAVLRYNQLVQQLAQLRQTYQQVLNQYNLALQMSRNLKSVYASLELADGANVSALTTVGNIRANSQTVQQQIANLEQDSLSGDAGLNTEVSVLNKINASNVLTLRTLQDANNLRVATLEQQVLHAKQQRDIDAANLNFAIQMRQQSTQNLAPFNSNLTQSLTSYRLP